MPYDIGVITGDVDEDSRGESNIMDESEKRDAGSNTGPNQPYAAMAALKEPVRSPSSVRDSLP